MRNNYKISVSTPVPVPFPISMLEKLLQGGGGGCSSVQGCGLSRVWLVLSSMLQSSLDRPAFVTDPERALVWV